MIKTTSVVNICMVLVVIFLQAGCSADTDNNNQSEKQEFYLFILAGQSNMAGRGQVHPIDKQSPKRVVKLSQKGKWVPATEPVHYDKPMAGVGPGRSFGKVIAGRDTTIKVGLIPCAVGGSSITAWKPGGYHQQTQTHPYDDCLARVQKARKEGTLKAILWHQGASDSNADQAPPYKKRLYKFVKDFRNDLGTSDLPFIAGELGRFECCPWDKWRTMVNEANASLPDAMPNTAFVSSDGLTHKGDSLHFDAASARELGRRYAKAYIKLMNENSERLNR